MKCNRKELFDALTALGKVADKKSGMPILSTVLLDSDGGSLTLRTTDLDRSLTTHMLADGELSACVSVDKLIKAVRPDDKREDDIDLELTKSALTVIADGMKLSLPVFPVADFPKATSDKGWLPLATYQVKEFATALDFVLSSASTDETRPHLSVVAWLPEHGVIASTDGHRLHTAPLPNIGKLKEDMSLPIVSAVRLRGVVKLGDDVLVLRRGNMARFCVDEWTLEAKLCDADFPPIEQVIPAKEVCAVVDAEKLTKACRKIGSMMERNVGVRVVVNGSITLSHDGPEDGEVGIEIAALSLPFSGEDKVFETAVNTAYFIDALANAERAEITIQAKLDPIRVDLPDGRLAVVMPCRI